MSEECPRVGKWFGGCHWEARYETRVDPELFSRCTKITGPIADVLGVEVYVRDVCRTCGKVKERTP